MFWICTKQRKETKFVQCYFLFVKHNLETMYSFWKKCIQIKYKSILIIYNDKCKLSVYLYLFFLFGLNRKKYLNSQQLHNKSKEKKSFNEMCNLIL